MHAPATPILCSRCASGMIFVAQVCQLHDEIAKCSRPSIIRYTRLSRAPRTTAHCTCLHAHHHSVLESCQGPLSNDPSEAKHSPKSLFQPDIFLLCSWRALRDQALDPSYLPKQAESPNAVTKVDMQQLAEEWGVAVDDWGTESHPTAADSKQQEQQMHSGVQAGSKQQPSQVEALPVREETPEVAVSAAAWGGDTDDDALSALLDKHVGMTDDKKSKKNKGKKTSRRQQQSAGDGEEDGNELKAHYICIVEVPSF